MDDAVITGTYADFKLIKTRQVAQVIIEVPQEQAKRVVDVFGLPQPNEEMWVAVAALKKERLAGNARASRAIQQAGILGKDTAFGVWLKNAKNFPEVDPHQPDTIEAAIRSVTGVKSRADWRTNEQALLIWERLYNEFSSQ